MGIAVPTTRLPRRRSLLVEVTPRCNLDCRYCYNVWKGPAPCPRGELDTRGLEVVLRRAVEGARCRSVVLTGGEPLLRDDLTEIVRFLRGLRVGVGLITNGTLLTEDRAAALIAAGVSVFEIPLLSPRRETQDALMRGDAHRGAIAAIANVRALGGRVAAVCVVTRENAADVGDVLTLAVGMGVDGVMLNRMNPGGEGLRHRDLWPGPDDLAAAFAAADRVAGRFGIPVASSVPVPPCVLDTRPYRHLTFGNCPLDRRDAYATIDPLGNVRPCNHSPTVLGNLADAPLGALLGSAAAREHAGATPEGCAGCRDLRTCRGGCRAAAEACNGDVRAPDPVRRAACATSSSS